jgi:molecular chaperone HscB
MDYFELYGIVPSMQIDREQIQKKYYQLSRQFHPDHFGLAEEAAREEALQMSSLINEGRRVLQTPILRLAYLLRQLGIVEEDEKYTLAPDFLMDMMEFNEQLMLLETDGDQTQHQALLNQLNETAENLRMPIQPYLELAQWNLDVLNPGLLKDYYYKMKYLERIKDNLKAFNQLD